ncbi:YlmC/YmxH family sporulation protein [Bacillus fonticola]|uniref:YlmC/YmxH family sporulation protein n=1 Tax=Bacillus fonticola TaxID=2728853 RepID=UPI0014746552|nr:YlmC/YmxH family sporulation protein [Bacillus fonticola]
MRLSELSGKEIIDVERAERMGVLGETDLEINEQGRIEALLIPTGKWRGFKKGSNEIRVPWRNIQTIGNEMVMMKFPHYETDNEDRY